MDALTVHRTGVLIDQDEDAIGTIPWRSNVDVTIAEWPALTSYRFRLYALTGGVRVVVADATVTSGDGDGAPQRVLASRGVGCDAYEVTAQLLTGGVVAVSVSIVAFGVQP